MKNTRIALCALAALSLAASSQSGGHQAEVKALRDNEARWNQEYAARDLDKIAAHYADDAVLMAPGSPSVTGLVEIRKMLKGMVDDPVLSLKFQAARVDVAGSGDLAYTQGAYQMTMTDPASKQVIHDRGSYVTTYRKQPDGSWKAVADIATSDAPPPAAASK